MPVNMNGTWNMISNENWEDYLKAIDVNADLIKKCNKVNIQYDISHDGDHMNIKVISTVVSYEMDFHVGKEWEEIMAPLDGRKCMSTVSWDIGGRLVCVQKGEVGGRGWTKWVVGDELHAELRGGGVVCRQVYRKTSVDLNGYWKMVSNENWEGYLKALDVNVDLIKKCNKLKLEYDITHDGDHINIKVISTYKNYEMDFYVGKEWEEIVAPVDGRTCMSTCTWDIGNRLVCVQKGEVDGRGWTKWVVGDEMVAELRAGGVVCKQVYKKI